MDNKLIPIPIGEPARQEFFNKDYSILQSYRFYDDKGNKINGFPTDSNNDVRYNEDSTGNRIYMFSNGVEYTSKDPLYYKKPSFGSTYGPYLKSFTRNNKQDNPNFNGGKKSRKNRKSSKKMRKRGKKSRKIRKH